MEKTTIYEPVAAPPDRGARPLWVGLRWGMAAGALYGLIGGGVIGYFANAYEAANGTMVIPDSQRLFSVGIFALPALLVGAILGAFGGAMTMPIVHWVLRRLEGVRCGGSWLVAIGVCLLLMLLVAAPVLYLLYADGNFLRGLEESLIFGIPFYLLPGIFYVAGMAIGTWRNFTRWFPERVLAS